MGISIVHKTERKVSLLKKNEILIPADVPRSMEKEYVRNFLAVTKETGRLFLFAGDQKIEHLNKDFYGKGISEDDMNPEHLFKVASSSNIGAFASQFGLISRYGRKYDDVDYIVKVNSKTNFVKTEQRDPVSKSLIDFDSVLSLRNTLKIRGVGYTIYLGSEFESEMLSEAGRLVNFAHKHGMLAVLWVYPRGKAVKKEKSWEVIAGAVGVAACLGADFVKVQRPSLGKGEKFEEACRVIAEAAGNTGVIFSGGSSREEKEFLGMKEEELKCGARGSATGRNIHQKSFRNAVKFCNAIASITYDGKSAEEAWREYSAEEK